MNKKIKLFLRKLFLTILPEEYKKIEFKKIRHFTWSDVGKVYMESEILLIKFLLSKDAVFFDVGANLGKYLYVAEQLIESKRNIHSFEPIPNLSKQISTRTSNRSGTC